MKGIQNLHTTIYKSQTKPNVKASIISQKKKSPRFIYCLSHAFYFSRAYDYRRAPRMTVNAYQYPFILGIHDYYDDGSIKNRTHEEESLNEKRIYAHTCVAPIALCTHKQGLKTGITRRCEIYFQCYKYGKINLSRTYVIVSRQEQRWVIDKKSCTVLLKIRV